MHLKYTRIAGLDTLILHPHPRISPENYKGAICLFHGFGASAENLLPVAQQLKPFEEMTVFLPNAPIERFSEDGIPSFAWWDLNHEQIIQRRMEVMSHGRIQDLYRDTPKGLHPARTAVLSFLEELALHIPNRIENVSNPLILGGFSQGAMLATDVALFTPIPIKGLCLFSGALINQSEWERQVPKPMKKIQSHGHKDSIIPFQLGEALHQFLEESSIHGKFLTFPGGHEIPKQVLDICRSEISSWTSKPN